ncbi:MAG TPA: PBP1A family penicillin-binding protein [Pyrinomonadaceae bacterium]|nr:PBP1A family penicillin-binding protein [Pyrinomonadaceae bacterium]
MPIRYPPEDNLPPPVNRRRRGRAEGRIVAYEQAEPPLWRRVSGRIFSAPVVIPLVFLATIGIGVLAYYWTVFSGRIDNLLAGEVFTRSAGIYAAPRQLRSGQTLAREDLIAYLQRAGYVEKSQQADSARGRYSIAGDTVGIEPSRHSLVDGVQQFQSLSIQFARSGKSISSLSTLDRKVRLEVAALEPELISSVTGRERAKRKVIGFNDLPEHLIKAITVTEDRSFFQHYGVNLRGILRALLRRYDNSDPDSPIARQGGSSITQQLVKNLLLSSERTLRRKLAEAYMSIILETRLTKEQIFALYCNQVYLGQHAGFSVHGFGEAADAYFNKDITNLSLPEAAFLAGLVRSPNRYNPYHNLKTATARRNQVLYSMVEVGALTQDEADRAKAEALKVTDVKGRIDVSDAPYFSDYVQQQLGDIIAGVDATQHLRIYTTIDMELQRAAYAALSRQLAALDKVQAKRFDPGTLQAALVAMNAKTGEIVAMVGGRDYSKSQLNRATDAMRQPGSVFKPFVYATALNTAYDPVPRVITPATVYVDEPKTFTFDNQEYSPGNFGNTYRNGPVTLRDALVQSLNVITVDVAMEVTMGRVMNLAAKAGLPRPPRAYPAMALGTSEATPLEVASAYTAFANLGTRTSPVAVNRITTGSGITIAAPSAQKSEVLRREVAYVMTSFMQDVVDRGTAARVRARGLKANVAGKTGTSRDGWFAGYTPNLVCVVWVGFDDGSQLGLTGANSALPIWTDFMQTALSTHPDWEGDWEMPAGIEQIEIDPKTGGLADPEDTEKRLELFLNGSGPVALPVDDELDVESEAEEEYPQEEGEPARLPEPSPGLPSRSRPDSAKQEDTGRLEGTITIDIDPSTGLIAVESCPVIRTRTFVIGSEPRKYCGPSFHKEKPSVPSGSSRPRTVATPPR